MSAIYTIDRDTGNVYITLSSTQASTFHSDHIKLDPTTVISEINNIVRDTFLRYHPASTPQKSDDGDDDEQVWDALFAQPHVQAGLSRLAEEAERQFSAGETEEGGFGVE